MTANQIAQLIGLTTQAYTNYQLDAKETADITTALFKLAKELGIHEETVTAVREFKIRNYEAPANG
jgi:transcriptional regulator with XRE-family HTH domain